MPETFSVDLDFERVLLDGAWYSRDDLTLRIKTMVDSGDFKVGRPSAALEALETALADLTTLTVKLSHGALIALSGAASRSGKTMESLARELIERSIAAPSTASTTVTVATRPLQLAPADPAAAPIPLTLPSSRAAPAVAAAPIALTPKKAPEPTAQSPASDAEHSWFNRR
jgi:hypothetical protein